MTWQEVASGSKEEPRTTSDTVSDRPPTAISSIFRGRLEAASWGTADGDLDLDKERLQDDEVPDLLERDERIHVYYDRGR